MNFLYKINIIRFSYGIVEVTRRPTLLSSTWGVFRYFSSLDKKHSDRYYTDKHEWVSIDGEIGTVGISHYAQEALGDIVFVQLPEVGTKLKKSDECGALESVKAASEIYSPVSGTVTEINVQVEELPGLINTNCLDRGWLFKLKFSDRKEIEQLMDHKRYAEFIKSDSNEK